MYLLSLCIFDFQYVLMFVNELVSVLSSSNVYISPSKNCLRQYIQVVCGFNTNPSIIYQLVPIGFERKLNLTDVAFGKHIVFGPTTSYLVNTKLGTIFYFW